MAKNIKKALFIAEIASSHNGSVKIFNKLVSDLIQTKVNIIKIQVYDIKYLAHKTYKYFDVLKKISLPKNIIKKNIIKILKNKKDVILEPFDENSFYFCEQFANKISIKVSSSDINNEKFILKALKSFKNIYISVSGLSLKDVKKISKKYKNNKKIIYTYGFQSFPTKILDLRLQFLKDLKKENHKICYADHTSRESFLENILVIKKAIENGANLIEKHVMLDRKKNYLDAVTSLDVKEFDEMINFFYKKIPSKKIISKKEIIYSLFMKRHAVSKKKLFKNKYLNLNDIIFLRTGKKGLNEKEINTYLNKKIKKNLKENVIIQKEFFTK